jgi:hypothetical protein
MAALFASGRIVDLILVMVVLEAVALWVWLRQTGQGPRLSGLLPNLLAGACLLAALRAALGGAPWPWIAGALAAGLAAHLWDLAVRFRIGGAAKAG